MSLDAIRIHCDGCDYRYLELFVPITIKCKVGDVVATYDHTTAWCNKCDGIKYVEYLPNLDELQFEYNRRTNPVPGSALKVRDCLYGSSKRLIGDIWYGGKIEDLKNRIIWRRSRVAPPHCLTCGSTDIMLVDYEQANANVLISKNFRHVCGGTLVIDSNNNNDSYIRFSFTESVIWVDIEGNILKQLLCTHPEVNPDNQNEDKSGQP